MYFKVNYDRAVDCYLNIYKLNVTVEELYLIIYIYKNRAFVCLSVCLSAMRTFTA